MKKYIIFFIIILLFLGYFLSQNASSRSAKLAYSDPIGIADTFEREILTTNTWYFIRLFNEKHPSLPLENLDWYTIWSFKFRDVDTDDDRAEMIPCEYISYSNEWVLNNNRADSYNVVFIEKVSDIKYRWNFLSDKEDVWVETTFSREGNHYKVIFDLYESHTFREISTSYQARNNPAVYSKNLPECNKDF